RDLAEHRGNIESRFGDLLRVAEGAAPVADANAAAAADPSATDDERVAALTALGFANPDGSAAELSRLARRRGTPFWAGANVAEQLTELRRFRNEEVLRIGLHDVAGALDSESVSRQLSDLADVCVAASLELAEAEVERREGTARHADGSRATLCVVGLGKLGGRELGDHS